MKNDGNLYQGPRNRRGGAQGTRAQQEICRGPTVSQKCTWARPPNYRQWDIYQKLLPELRRAFAPAALPLSCHSLLNLRLSALVAISPPDSCPQGSPRSFRGLEYSPFEAGTSFCVLSCSKGKRIVVFDRAIILWIFRIASSRNDWY